MHTTSTYSEDNDFETIQVTELQKEVILNFKVIEFERRYFNSRGNTISFTDEGEYF